jgi:hypothetical protein
MHRIRLSKQQPLLKDKTYLDDPLSQQLFWGEATPMVQHALSLQHYATKFSRYPDPDNAKKL